MASFFSVLQGIACYVNACKALLHDHCYARYQRANAICPACKADWSRPEKLRSIGEGAAKDGDDRRRTRRATQSVNDEDEDEEMEPPDDEEMDDA